LKWCAVADLPNKERIAKFLRMLGSTDSERRVAFAFLEREMRSEGISWTDIGDAIENSADGKFTEEEMREFSAAVRAEGVEAGIKVGLARAQQGNGRLSLPSPSQMAEHCHQQLSRLKDDKQREFINDMYLITRRRMNLSLGRLGYLASIYIQIGGRIQC
jgi:hypothetical protein